MKAISLVLQDSVVSVYDQTKTTVLGRAAQKTLSALQGGKQVVGTPLPSFADVTTDAAITPIRVVVTANGRAFFFSAPAAGVGTIAMYSFDLSTGVYAFVGKLAYTLPNSPATTHTIRTVRAIDSGTTGWKIFVGTVGTITTNGGLFMLGHGSGGVALSDFVPSGFITLPVATAANQKAVYFLQESGGTNNLIAMSGFGLDIAGNKVYAANGLAAAYVGYVFDLSLTITTVNAGGITPDLFVLKTGVLPGVVGTLLLINSVNLCTPTSDSGAPVGVQGSLCIFSPGSTAFNIGKVSEWTSGATSWPSLVQADVLDAASMNTANVPLTAHFSDTLQRIVFQLNSGNWVIKKFVNSVYEFVFGSASNTQYRTANPLAFYEFGAVVVTSTFTSLGWIFNVNGTTAGQIGAQAFDLRSLYQFDYSSIISKVIDTPSSQWLSLAINSPLRSFGKFFYRITGFGSATGNWLDVPTDRVLSALSSAAQVQFKFQPRMERDGSTVPLQLIEAHLILQPNSEISDYWEYSREKSASGSPTDCVFRLKKVYATAVPAGIHFRAHDLTDVQLLDHNTTANAANFNYSSNDGGSYSPLGTIPNVVGTLLRYRFSSPPGVDIRPSLREA